MFRYISYLLLLFPALGHAQCDVVAVVFETTICQADITFQQNRRGAKPVSSERQLEVENLRLAQKIRAISAEHLLAKSSYTPSKEEIDSYSTFSEKFEQRRPKQTRELISTIEHLLKTYQYTDKHRKRLEEGLAVFRKSEEQSKQIEEGNRLRDEDMKKRLGEEGLKAFHLKLSQSRNRIYTQWVSSWKMNKALYEKYGGRIIFQQAGIEPVDAYRAQLKDIREKGRLKIHKSAYMDVFAELERYLDMGHNYLRDEGKKYFDRPYWETANIEESHQRAIKDYTAIAHK